MTPDDAARALGLTRRDLWTREEAAAHITAVSGRPLRANTLRCRRANHVGYVKLGDADQADVFYPAPWVREYAEYRRRFALGEERGRYKGLVGPQNLPTATLSARERLLAHHTRQREAHLRMVMTLRNPTLSRVTLAHESEIIRADTPVARITDTMTVYLDRQASRWTWTADLAPGEEARRKVRAVWRDVLDDHRRTLSLYDAAARECVLPGPGPAGAYLTDVARDEIGLWEIEAAMRIPRSKRKPLLASRRNVSLGR